MQNQGVERWFNKHLSKLTIGACILILILPFLLTRETFLPFDFSSTGQIGDTIAGTTTPFIGIITIVLVYLTYTSQKEELEKARNLVAQQTNFMAEQINDSKLSQRINAIENLIKETLDFIERIEWDNYVGIAALRKFEPNKRDKEDKEIIHTLPDELNAILIRFEILIKSIDAITSEEVKETYLNRVHTIYYSKILWNVNVNIFDKYAEQLYTDNDDCELMIPTYCDLSIKSIEYLIDKGLVRDSQWKKENIEKFHNFLKK